jgi:hypothetical protein
VRFDAAECRSWTFDGGRGTAPQKAEYVLGRVVGLHRSPPGGSPRAMPSLDRGVVFRPRTADKRYLMTSGVPLCRILQASFEA